MLGAMGTGEPLELQIFVEAGCETCQRALQIAGEFDDEYPRLAVRVVDVAKTQVDRDDVFAVPTFVLNDRVLSLGNPRRSHLRNEIEALLERRGLR